VLYAEHQPNQHAKESAGVVMMKLEEENLYQCDSCSDAAEFGC